MTEKTEKDPSINSGQDKKEDEHKEAHIPRITLNRSGRRQPI